MRILSAGSRQWPLVLVVAISCGSWTGASAQERDERQVADPTQGTYRADNIGIEYTLVPYRGHYAAKLTGPPAPNSPGTRMIDGNGRRWTLVPGDLIIALDQQLIDGPNHVVGHIARTTVDVVDAQTGQVARYVMQLPNGQGGGMAANESRKVRALLVIDTDSGLAGLDEDQKSIETLLKPLRDQGRCDRPTVLRGGEVNASNVLGWLDRQPEASSETILVYFSGHGATDPYKGHYLAPTHGPRLLRARIREEMRKRNPRLAILLTDCCSNIAPLAPAPGAPALDERVVKDLFLRTRGFVDITGSETGDSSWCGESGGFFTTALRLTVFRGSDELDRDGNKLVSWNDILPLVKDETSQAYKGFRTAVLNDPGRYQRRVVDALRGQPDQRPQAFSLDQP